MRDFKFIPSQQLIKLAETFSSNWETLSVGTYYSDDKQYGIIYEEKLLDTKTGREVNTNLRVSIDSGLIGISQNKLREQGTSNNYLFFMILWCAAEYNLKNLVKSDLMTMEYYLTTGRPVKDVLIGYAKLFKTATTSENINRMENLFALCKADKEGNVNSICQTCKYLRYKSGDNFENRKICIKKFWNDVSCLLSDDKPVVLCELYQEEGGNNE